MSSILSAAIKWKHPNARVHIKDGGITTWGDPDGAPQPDEASILVEYAPVHDARLAMSKWEESMSATDKGMPRINEDIIDTMSVAQKAKLPQMVQDNHAAKKVSRGTKP